MKDSAQSPLIECLEAANWPAFDLALARVHEEDFHHAILADTVLALCRHDFCEKTQTHPVKRVEVLDQLLTAGADLEGSVGDEALQSAVIGNDALLLDALLLRQARPTNTPGRSLPNLGPVLYAMGLGHVDLLEKLVAHGADLFAVDAAGCTGLCYAAAGNREDMIRFLVHHGISPNVRDDRGRTALASEATDMLPSTIDLLVSLGASLRVVDKEGLTLSHHAQGNAPGCVYLRTLLQARNLRAATVSPRGSSSHRVRL